MATKPARTFSPETLRMLVLVAICALIWCFVQHRWTAAAWKTPVEYTADPGAMDVIAVFAGFKAAGDGYLVPFLPKTNRDLGAPFVANWNDYPSNDQLQIFLCGLLVDTLGLFPAANLVLLAVHVLAAMMFYLVCRRLKCAWPWAFAGAIVFGFATYAFAQGQHHLTLSMYWHVPLCLLVCRWASTGSGLRWGSRRYKIALGIAFIAGIQNVYYASMFIQLLGLGCLLQLVRRRWSAIASAISLGTFTLATFLLMNVNTFVYHLQHGPNHVVVSRKYAEIEFTALKFTDFFMPWQHRIHSFASWARDYYVNSWVHGEYPPASYFGIVGLAGLVWLAVASFRRFTARPARPLPLEIFQIAWTFLYSTVGGVNGLIGNFGFILFRATTRYSIFILCIVLIFLVRRISVATTRMQPILVAALATLLIAMALWDQVPAVKTDADLRQTASLADSDRVFTEAMEAKLPEGAMVFQVPICDFPENFSHSLPSYDHFRPYLYSTHLRFSFGDDKGRPRSDWQHLLNGRPLNEILAAIENYGFSGLYVNRPAFDDKGNSLIAYLRETGHTDMITSPNGDLVCIMLHPIAHKIPPPPAPER